MEKAFDRMEWSLINILHCLGFNLNQIKMIEECISYKRQKMKTSCKEKMSQIKYQDQSCIVSRCSSNFEEGLPFGSQQDTGVSSQISKVVDSIINSAKILSLFQQKRHRKSSKRNLSNAKPETIPLTRHLPGNPNELYKIQQRSTTRSSDREN